MQKERGLRIRIIFSILIVCAFAIKADAQTLMDKLEKTSEYISHDDYHSALELLKKIEPQCVSSDNDTVKVFFCKNMGYVCFESKNYSDAIHYFEPVPSLYEKLNLKDIDYIEAFLALGMANQNLGHDSIAEGYYRKGLLKTVFLKGTENYRPSFYLNLGNLYKERGDTLLASECFKQIDPREYGTTIDAQDDYIDDELKALEYRKNGEFEAAINIYDRLIDKTKEIIGSTNDDYARLVYSKAIVLGENLKKNEEAFPLYSEVVGLKKYIGECSEEYLGSLYRYLQLLAYYGQESELNELLPEAIETVQNCKNQYCTLALLYRLIGNGAYWSQRYKLAIPFYEKYIAEGGDNAGNSMIEIPNMLAVSYILTNEPDPESALAILSNLEKNDELDNLPDLKATVLHNLGRTLMLLNRKSEAIKYLTESNSLFKSIHGQDNSRTIQYIKECAE